MKRLFAFIVMLVLAPVAAAHHGEDIHAEPATLAPLWVGPAFSGSWYSTDRSGEGFILQLLENGSALLLICRSGVRSHYAAEILAEAGFTRVYNVLDGFEKGWRPAGLPWVK